MEHFTKNLEELHIGIVGIGYVGLPLAKEFSKLYDVVGFDNDPSRVNELSRGFDRTNEVPAGALAACAKLRFSNQIEDLKDCNVYIVTVPTPVDVNQKPDLKPLLQASATLGTLLKTGDLVIYESTVYPGVTEDECVPVLERESGLTINLDFWVGYSPERINPGDKSRSLVDIVKVTSGSCSAAGDFVDALYSRIISAGTFKAESIKVAEAAKVVENVQRDVNIALVNELHQLFYLLDIDTKSVMDAASTKWNFSKYSPGLVGGHCIGVDPYYLLHKAGQSGYVPNLIRNAREVNESMPSFVAKAFLKELLRLRINPLEIKVLFCGFSFKENCPDIRNTKAFDLYLELTNMGLNIVVYDPLVDVSEVQNHYGVNVISELTGEDTRVAILVTPHKEIIESLKTQKFDLLFDFRSALTD